MLCAWLVTVQYGLGVVRGALDEGARAGAVFGGGEGVCERVASDTLSQLLSGRLGGSSVTCRQSGTQLVAEATGTFEAWLPGVPDWTFTLRASSAVEP